MNKFTNSGHSRLISALLVLPIVLTCSTKACQARSPEVRSSEPISRNQRSREPLSKNAISLLAKELQSTRKEDLKEAIARQSAEIKLHPKQSLTYAARICLTDRLGEKKQSEKLIADMSKLFGEATCYAEIAWSYEAAGDFRKSLIYDDLSLAKRPHRHVFASRANSLRVMGRFKESIESANQALALGYEDKALVYEIKAYTYAKWGKQKEALAEFSRAILADKKNAERYCRRGQYLHSIGKYKLAKQDLDMAIALAPGKPCYYEILICFCQADHDSDGMFAAAHKFYRLAPQDREMREQMSQCLGWQFNIFRGCADQQALDQCNRWVLQYNNDYWPYTLRAHLNAFLTNTKPALADYTKAIALGDKSATTYEGRANLLMLDNKISDAIADYTKALSIDPDCSKAYLERGDAYRRIRQSDKAIKDYARVASKSAKGLHVYRYLGKAFVDQHRHEEAIQAFSSELKNFPLDNQTYADRAQAYLAMNKPDKALADMNDAIALKAKEPLFYRSRAAIYDRMGDSQAAAKDRARADSFGKALIEY